MLKNILICGIGGVGGYFGGKIAYKINSVKNPPYNIFFLARGKHLEEIQKQGLELHTSENETLLCKPTLASDDINDFPPPQLCFICVKSYDLDALINQIQHKLMNDTCIIPLMNGIDIYERIRKNLKKSIVFPSCVYVGSHIEKPGVVIQTGNPGFFRLGYDPKYPHFKPNKILELFKELKIKAIWEDNPNPAIWEKFLLVASFALVSAHYSQTLGQIIEDKQSRHLLEKIMEEIVMIANKKGISLKKNIIQDTIDFCRYYPKVIPSYSRDVQKGGKNEGDLYGGAIIRMGKKYEVPTPTTASVYNQDL